MHEHEVESRFQIVVAYKAPRWLVALMDADAKAEGATRAGIARRLAMQVYASRRAGKPAGAFQQGDAA